MHFQNVLGFPLVLALVVLVVLAVLLVLVVLVLVARVLVVLVVLGASRTTSTTVRVSWYSGLDTCVVKSVRAHAWRARKGNAVLA